MISKKHLDISFIRRQILLAISVTCSPWTRMTPAHVIVKYSILTICCCSVVVRGSLNHSRQDKGSFSKKTTFINNNITTPSWRRAHTYLSIIHCEHSRDAMSRHMSRHPCHVINNFTSVNLANLLRLMSCVLKSLTTSLCSIFWIVKASARPFRSLSFLTASCMFILFADLAQNHVPNGASLQVTLRFAQEKELKPIFSPLLNGPDLWQSILMWELQNPLGAVNFVKVDCIVFLNVLRLAFGIWMAVLRKDHRKVENNSQEHRTKEIKKHIAFNTT